MLNNLFQRNKENKLINELIRINKNLEKKQIEKLN
jgi:hypothetical protein